MLSSGHAYIQSTSTLTHIHSITHTSTFQLQFIYFIEFFKSNVHATFHASHHKYMMSDGKKHH